jgi:hypothetical protein
MLRSRARASRQDLENGNTRANSNFWTSVADEFNDRTFNSSGLVALHECLTREYVNPEDPNPVKITALHCYNIFWEVQKVYAVCYKNFQASGQHNGHDFWLYSKSKLDVLYMYLWLMKIPRQDIRNFYQTGHEIEAGFDASIPNSTNIPTTTPTTAIAPPNNSLLFVNHLMH